MKKKMFLLVVLFPILSFSISTDSVLMLSTKDLTLPATWTGCQGVAGNVNQILVNANSANVISAFWDALVGLQLGETKYFVIPSTEHPYTNEFLGKDLYYIVRIDSIATGGTTVLSSSTVDVFYSLYLDCIIVSGGSAPIIPSSPPEDFVVNSTIPINVVFIGFNESVLDINRINNSLTNWYAPTILRPLGGAGANLTLDINYHLSNSTSLEGDFVSYLSSIATWGSAPSDLLTYDSGASGAFYISASNAISWLDNNINTYFGSINNSYSLYIINTYTWGYVSDYYYYDFSFPDPDTGVESGETLTILYGGDYPNRGVFLDISAGPVNYHESDTSEENEGVSASTIQPIWEYSFPQDIAKLNDNLTEYIQETIDLVFTPSYIYEPVIKNRFDVSVYIFDNTSLGTVYNNPLNFINTTLIDSTFDKLIPYSDWNTSYFINFLSNHPGLTQVIKNSYALTNQTEFPNAINPYQDVINYLNENRSEFGMTDETIPVFIFAWDEVLFFGSEFVLGRAIADENENALMVISGYNPVLYPNSGYTHLIIHEVGHILSLRHPHDGWSWDKFNKTGNPSVLDWLRDFISTPMSYAHKDVTFSTFDYDNLDRGHVFQRINSSWHYLYSTNNSLITKGYQYLDQSLNASLNSVLGNRTIALQFFDNLDYETAFIYANLSYFSALEYYNYALSFPNIIPSLKAPLNDVTISISNVLLEWDSLSNAIKYRILIADNSQLNSPIVNITTFSTSFSFTTLEDDTYFWSVQAIDSNNWGARSPVWSFTIDTSPPPTSNSTPTSTSESPTSSVVSSRSDSSSINPSTTSGFSILSAFVIFLISIILIRKRKR
ncbi:MAG: hypothetical protein ACW967_04765 [Candidatus Hodarchaeales archaeon]